MDTYLRIGEVTYMLHVSLSTMYRWSKSNKLKENFRTLGNHRRYSFEKIEQRFFPRRRARPEKTVVYCRVSSHDQKKDLLTQEEKLLNYCKVNNYHEVEVIRDLGSGLNYGKKGLLKLIDLILNRKIARLIINHKDRLLRFGSEIIFKLCVHYKVKVIMLEEKVLTFEESLVSNVIELMTVFCAKLYGKRSHKNKLKPLEVSTT